MKRLLVLCLVGLVCASSCEKAPPKPKDPPPPPPKTAEELHGQVMNAVGPLMNGAPGGGQMLKGALSGELGKLRAEQNGEKARQLVENDVKEALKAAFDGERWEEVLNLCDGVDAVDQGNTRAVRYRERAVAEKNKPQVTMKGVFQIDGNPTIFFDVYLPETGETKDVKVREGEEFYGLVLEKILGDKEGVQLKYLKTEQSFTVKGVAQ